MASATRRVLDAHAEMPTGGAVRLMGPNATRRSMPHVAAIGTLAQVALVWAVQPVIEESVSACESAHQVAYLGAEAALLLVPSCAFAMPLATPPYVP